MNLLLHSPSNIVNPLARQRFMGFGTGSSGGASFVGALDAYSSNLAGAWSVVRRLLSSYSGSLIRIRRSSDSAEQDIGVTSAGLLDTAAITAFVGANSAFVRKVYDQSGLGRDYTQATAAQQPRMVNSGTLVTNNGQPAIFNIAASNTFLSTTSFAVRTWIVSAHQTTNQDYSGLLTGAVTNIILISTAPPIGVFIPTPAGYAYFVNGVNETSDLSPWCLEATKVLSLTGASTTEGWQWGRERNIAGRYFPGYYQEQILYSDVSAHRTAVESAMMEVLGL